MTGGFSSLAVFRQSLVRHLQREVERDIGEGAMLSVLRDLLGIIPVALGIYLVTRQAAPAQPVSP